MKCADFVAIHIICASDFARDYRHSLTLFQCCFNNEAISEPEKKLVEQLFIKYYRLMLYVANDILKPELDGN